MVNGENNLGRKIKYPLGVSLSADCRGIMVELTVRIKNKKFSNISFANYSAKTWAKLVLIVTKCCFGGCSLCDKVIKSVHQLPETYAVRKDGSCNGQILTDSRMWLKVSHFVVSLSLYLQRDLKHWAHGIEDTNSLSVVLYILIYFTLHCEDLSTIQTFPEIMGNKEGKGFEKSVD